MSGAKKSIDEIWKELNAPKPKPRQGVAGLAGGLGGIANLPGITSVVRTKPATSTPHIVAPAAQERPQLDLHDSPYSASAVGGDTAAYLATLQRTINCLADLDRALRRGAATTLQAKLFTGDASTPKASPTQLQELLCGPLLRPLVAMLSDSVERCRTVALAVLLEGGKQLSDVSPMLPELVPALARRFGALPVEEPAEEIRLQIAQLTLLLLTSAPPTQIARFAPELAAIMCRSLEDGFPDIKKVGCSAIEAAAARLPFAALEPEAEKLVNSLAPNLQHQHSRVRLACIQALDALVAAGAAMALVEGSVATALRPVGHDRAQPVREAAFTALALWMGYRDDGAGVGAGRSDGSPDSASGTDRPPPQQQQQPSAYVTSLLPLLIVGVTDPQPATAELALRLVEGVGEAWNGSSCNGKPEAPGASQGTTESRDGGPGGAAPEAGAATDAAATSTSGGSSDDGGTLAPVAVYGADGEAAVKADADAGAAAVAARVAACGLGPPYNGSRPGAGCRAMVRALLPQHLPPLVRQLSEWTSGLRVAAARGLHTTLVLAEDGAAAHLRLLLPALCSAIADEELEVASYVISSVHVLGAHVDPADWMPRMLEALSPAGAGEAAPSSSGSSSGSGAGERPQAASGGLSASQRTHMLVVLSGLLHAAGRAGRALPPPLLASLAGVLADEAMLAAAAEHAAVRQQLLAATANAVAWGGAACAAVALQLHVVLLQLYGSELAAAAPPPGAPSAAAGGAAPAPGGGDAGGSVSPALAAMSKLAACCGLTSTGIDAEAGGGIGTAAADGAAALAARHANWLVAALFGGECPAAPTPVPTSASPPPAPPAHPSTSGGASSAPPPSATAAAAAPPPPPPPLAWQPRAGDATWLCVLRATLLTCSPATLEGLAPALVSALHPIVGDKEREAPLRLALLQLMDGVLEDTQRGPALARGAGQALLSDVLLPPLVWQAGKTAAAVRYAAVTALATLLGRRLPEPQHMLAVVEPPAAASADSAPPARPAAGAAAGGSGGLLPLLSSALDEDWYTDMRLAACYVTEKLLELIGPQLSDASRRALYPELHKRLDDAHNAVRVAACGALRAFVAAAGPGYCDTNSGYLVAGVVIHMDDGDQAVQEAACSVLLAAAAAKPAVTAAEVRKVRERFRSKHYCDRVLAACEAATASSGQAAA